MWSTCIWFPQMGGRESRLGLEGHKTSLPSPANGVWSLNALEMGGDIGPKGEGHQLQSHPPFAFSSQGTCYLQCPGCCPHGSCHLPTTGGHGVAGGRRVPLLLQVSLASLSVLHTPLTPALQPHLTGAPLSSQAPGEESPATSPNSSSPL